MSYPHLGLPGLGLVLYSNVANLCRGKRGAASKTECALCSLSGDFSAERSPSFIVAKTVLIFLVVDGFDGAAGAQTLLLGGALLLPMLFESKELTKIELTDA